MSTAGRLASFPNQIHRGVKRETRDRGREASRGAGARNRHVLLRPKAISLRKLLSKLTQSREREREAWVGARGREGAGAGGGRERGRGREGQAREERGEYGLKTKRREKDSQKTKGGEERRKG